MGKALGASGATSGDTVYVGAGTYREVVTVNTSPASTLSMIADVDGKNTGDAGPVIWSAYLTDDNTAASATTQLNLNGKSFLLFDGFFLQGGAAQQILATTTTSSNITFRRCVFKAPETSLNNIQWTNAAGVAAHWLVDRCVFIGSTSTTFLLTATASGGADYDLDFVIQNCVFLGGNNNICLYCDASGTTGKPGGIVCLNSTFLSASTGLRLVNANYSTSITSKCYNCIFSETLNALVAVTSGSLVEDYNHLGIGTRTNVSAGANSVTGNNRAMSLDWGYASLNGFVPRPFFMPRSGSTLLGFGNSGTVSPPTVDILNRPRPSGGASTSNGIGAYELHDFGAKENSVVDASTSSLKLTGPGDHDQVIPVDAVATTITVRGRYDTNHGTTNKPQVILQTNGQIGVTTQTVTMTVTTDTWETLTIGPFTPTAKGFVTVRLVSRAAAGSGNAYFDTITSTSTIGTGNEDYWRYGEAFPAATTSGAGGGLLLNPSLEGM